MSSWGSLCVFLARIDGEEKEAGQHRQERHSQSAEPRVGEWLSAFFKKAGEILVALS